MKKILLSLIVLFCGIYSYAQIDGVIVDEFTPTAAAVTADPNLSGVTTYRIFIDMSAGWELVNVTGLPGNPLYFETDAGFYNNGIQFIPPVASAPTVDQPAFYDTYIAIGGGGFFGTPFLYSPLAEDATGDVNDGIVDGSGLQPVVLGATNYSLFFGTGGASADLSNPDWVDQSAWSGGGASSQAGTPGSNSVCIGQWSTTGSFTTEFGVSLKDPVSGDVIAYTYRSGAGTAQIQDDNLFFTNQEDNNAPTATIVNLIANQNVPYNSNVTVQVDVNANNSSAELKALESIEILVDGTDTYVTSLAGTSADSGPFDIVWPTGLIEGARTLEVRAIKLADNLIGPYSTAITVNAVRDLVAPAASLTATPSTVFDSETILFEVVISDPGSRPISDVEFIVDGVSLQGGSATPSTATSYTWTADVIGAAVPVEVIVTNEDNQSVSLTTSVRVISSAASYEIVSVEEDCSVADRFCVPIRKIGDALANVTGFEFKMTYDAVKVTPTGVVMVYPNAGGADDSNTDYFVNDLGDGTMYVAIFLDGNSTAGQVWEGVDENLFCVEFVKKNAFLPVDQVVFTASEIIESSISGVSDPKLASDGTYSTIVNSIYTGYTKFWKDLQPIDGTGGAFNVTTRITSISDPTYFVVADANGQFDYDFSNGAEFNIRKQIDNNAAIEVLPQVYSGFDAYLTAKVVTNDLSYRPSPFEIVSMDVNLDGKVSAGDISQINQRSVRVIEEFQEQDGTSSPDWRWVNEDTPTAEPSWKISETYPEDDMVGYSKVRLPEIPVSFDLNNQVANLDACPVVVNNNNTYLGIVTGDVDGSWKTADVGTGLKSGDVEAVVFDINNMYIEESFVNIPVIVRSEKVVNSLNSVLGFNNDLIFENIVSHSDHIEYLYNTEGNYVSLTSYSLKEYDINEPLFTFRFYAPNGFRSTDFVEAYAWLNGEVTDAILSATSIKPSEITVKLYPNPASDYITLEVAENVEIAIVDVQGKVLLEKSNLVGLEKIDISKFESGVYMMKISGKSGFALKQIVIQK